MIHSSTTHKVTGNTATKEASHDLQKTVQQQYRVALPSKNDEPQPLYHPLLSMHTVRMSTANRHHY